MTPLPPSALSPDDCRALLDTALLGRVALSVGALPRIYPVRFGVHGEDIVFRIPIETPIARALDGTVVAFEADSLSHGQSRGWTVAVIGEAEIVDDEDYRKTVGGVAPRAWHFVGADRLVRVPMTVVSGHFLYHTGAVSSSL